MGPPGCSVPTIAYVAPGPASWAQWVWGLASGPRRGFSFPFSKKNLTKIGDFLSPRVGSGIPPASPHATPTVGCSVSCDTLEGLEAIMKVG